MKNLERYIKMNNQIIGCAYTYPGSLGIRRKFTENLKEEAYHSSQERDFSYFYKGDTETAINNGDKLRLRDNTKHWPEAELAVILGRKHEIVGYSLANDFTAIEIETQGRTKDFDGTYFGKVWKGSCGLNSKIVSPNEIYVNNLEIGLKIERNGSVIYDHTYNTQRRKRDFKELPDMIVDYHKTFDEDIPESKKINLENGFLSEGSVILAGTCLIVPGRCYSLAGDLITVYNSKMGELQNQVA